MQFTAAQLPRLKGVVLHSLAVMRMIGMWSLTQNSAGKILELEGLLSSLPVLLLNLGYCGVPWLDLKLNKQTSGRTLHREEEQKTQGQPLDSHVQCLWSSECWCIQWILT